jgi:hypothetical protein
MYKREFKKSRAYKIQLVKAKYKEDHQPEGHLLIDLKDKKL